MQPFHIAKEGNLDECQEHANIASSVRAEINSTNTVIIWHLRDCLELEFVCSEVTHLAWAIQRKTEIYRNTCP